MDAFLSIESNILIEIVLGFLSPTIQQQTPIKDTKRQKPVNATRIADHMGKKPKNSESGSWRGVEACVVVEYLYVRKYFSSYLCLKPDAAKKGPPDEQIKTKINRFSRIQSIKI
ncbi:hypothetical protein BpHYR1_005408 [Brachionus plicatilis]|uniref:Uncharacterized protein n=1 Tax=Brachionus plicatilis TaxID=10195 RepID=A0A3M7P6K9_BRAPC|nr:hypothetical protein BpHYR1_005408 [Brachionus plicatilis]